MDKFWILTKIQKIILFILILVLLSVSFPNLFSCCNIKINLEADFLLSAQILITQFLNVSSPNFIALTKSNCVDINTLTLIKKNNLQTKMEKDSQ